MAFFGLKTYFKKIFLGYFCPPIKVMWKNRAKKASKWVFIGGGFKSPPPNWCQFQRVLMVGLTLPYGPLEWTWNDERQGYGLVSYSLGKVTTNLFWILGTFWSEYEKYSALSAQKWWIFTLILINRNNLSSFSRIKCRIIRI